MQVFSPRITDEIPDKPLNNKIENVLNTEERQTIHILFGLSLVCFFAVFP